MGLINLRTNLKDLKFGQDEYKGGSSGQPFIQTRIPATDEPLQTGISNAGPVLASVGAGAVIGIIGGSAAGAVGAGAAIGAALGLGIGIAGSNATGNSLRLPSAGTGGPDFLLRGGTLLPGILANDAIRLTKYFASTEGVLFTTKQNLLSRLAVKTQASPRLLNDGVYTPLSSLSQAIGNPFGLHVNKQGLNPFLGIGDSYTPDRYFDAIKNEVNLNEIYYSNLFNNRLVSLYTIKITDTGISREYYNKNNISDSSLALLSYEGGPNSFLGIGKTLIPLALDNFGAPLSVATEKKLLTQNNLSLTYKEISEINTQNISDDGSSAYIGFINSTDVNISQQTLGYGNTNKIGDFRKNIKGERALGVPDSPNYGVDNIEQRVNLGNPGGPFRNLKDYSKGLVLNNPTNIDSVGAANGFSFDKITWSTIYNSNSDRLNITQETRNNLRDLVQFRMGVINNNNPSKSTFMHFRAFLDQISDNYSSNWDPTKYIGRGENFYTYSGFDRKVSLGWTVAAQSKAELIPMYRKLNYLASICTPDYSPDGYMRGNIITLTIGGYFYEQPGIITSLNYEMNSDNETWEIGIDTDGVRDSTVKELPHIIRVTGFNFIPIHTFVPRKQKFSGGTFRDNTGTSPEIPSTFGPERYISLNDGISNGYGTPYNGIGE